MTALEQGPIDPKKTCRQCGWSGPLGVEHKCDVVPSKTVTLPTWEECEKAVDGGYATHLQTFIYHNEPADVGIEGALTEADFRKQLALLIEYERQPLPDETPAELHRCLHVEQIEAIEAKLGVPAQYPTIGHALEVLLETSVALRDVMAERARQQSAEGYTTEHDDHHKDGSIAKAASCYALCAGIATASAGGYENHYEFTKVYADAACPAPPWPWGEDAWKPKSPRRDLVRAAALILAEIERMDRGAVKTTSPLLPCGHSNRSLCDEDCARKP